MNEREERRLSFESTSVLFWLFMDFFLSKEWIGLLYASAAISILFSFLVFFYLEKSFVSILVALADHFWISAGVFWATADVFALDWCKTATEACFIASIFCAVFAYIKAGANREAANFVLRRLRVIRVLTNSVKRSK